MKEPFELEVGEIVEFGGESYICVKDGVKNDFSLLAWCFECAFFHTEHCGSMNCIGRDRKDGTGVHFKKKESTTTSQIISK